MEDGDDPQNFKEGINQDTRHFEKRGVDVAQLDGEEQERFPQSGRGCLANAVINEGVRGRVRGGSRNRKGKKPANGETPLRKIQKKNGGRCLWACLKSYKEKNSRAEKEGELPPRSLYQKGAKLEGVSSRI